MNEPQKEFFDELMQQVSLIEKSRILNEGGGCERPGPGGDCEHYVGLPGKSIPRQHDGPDDTLDMYDKPNGWCWSCWKSRQIEKLRGEVRALEAWQNVAAESNRNVSAYLQKEFPSLGLDGDVPISNIHRVVEYLEDQIDRLKMTLRWCSRSSDFHKGGIANNGWEKMVQPHVGGKIENCPEWRHVISASEALFGFMGWLTTRDEAVTFSGHHDAAIAADLVGLFCEVNGLAEPRDHWEKNLVHPKDHPKECHPSKEIGGITEADRPPSPWRPELERILSALSGDLSQNNVAAAKQIVKKMLKERCNVISR